MEILVANVVGRVRHATANGKQYLVAPLRLIVPGVLNGSKGALFYPPEECAKNPASWNHMPLVVYHPQTPTGNHVSARDPDILARQGIGYVWKANAKKGPLDAEGWFDIEACNRVDNRILTALQQGQQIELSTGLYTDNEPAPAGATYNGRPYTHVARNYRPDHVAILPDQIGACSVQDGCGVLVNEQSEPTENRAGLLSRLLDWLTGNTPSLAANASPNQPRHAETGQYLPHGAGTGKGDVHQAAVGGAAHTPPATPSSDALDVPDEEDLSEQDRVYGADARKQKAETGHNPPSWVADEPIWEKAKEAAGKSGKYEEGSDTYWAVVSHIYQQMGGEVKKGGPTANVWSDAAREAAIEARKASMKASEKTSGLSMSSRLSSGTIKDVSGHATKAEGLAQKAAGHAEAGRFDKAQSHHEDAARAHMEAYSTLSKSGDFRAHEAAGEHLKAYEAHGNAYMKMAEGQVSNAAADLHDNPASQAQQLSDRADQHTRGAKDDKTHKAAMEAHEDAAEAHRSAAKASGDDQSGRQMHEQKADYHDAKAGEHRAKCGETTMNDLNDLTANTWSDAAREAAIAARQAKAKGEAGQSKREGDQIKAAHDASEKANNASQAVRNKGLKPTWRDHQDAAQAHNDASRSHFTAATLQHSAVAYKAHEDASNAHMKAAVAHRDAAAKMTPTGNKDTAMTPEQKKILIDSLVANCSCQKAQTWAEADRPTLNSLPDEMLTKLLQQRQDLIDADLTANQASSRAGAKPATAQEWFSQAPAEVQQTFAYAREIEQREKMRTIDQLTANVKDPEQKKAVGARLAAKPLGELRDLVQLLPPLPPPAFSGSPSAADPLYLGAATPAFNTADIPDDNSMDPPTLNWAELATENARRHAS